MATVQQVRDTFGPSWIRQIVVAVDSSPASLEGLRLAVDAARRSAARLAVVHVRHAPAGSSLGPSFAFGQIKDTLDELEASTRAAAADHLQGSGLDWEVVVLTGSPGEEIVDFAKSVNADLVVVGSNRHSAAHNLVLGSTSAYLTSHSPAAVLVVRPRTEIESETKDPALTAGLAS